VGKIYFLIALAFLVVIALQVYTYKSIPEIVYVNTNELYNEFDLKKELENNLAQVQNKRKEILDSLRIKVQLLAKEIEVNKIEMGEQVNQFQVLRQEYLLKEQQFAEDNASLTKQYNDQIWQQLNQYVKDYGEKHSHKFILGANGSGNLMYSREESDVSKEVIKYVNERYKGAAK
jgi:outer membrane protein